MRWERQHHIVLSRRNCEKLLEMLDLGAGLWEVRPDTLYALLRWGPSEEDDRS